MDNVCHTLVGAAIGEAGLKSRTRFGNPALMIASNLPDIDVLVFATGTPAGFVPKGMDPRCAGAGAVAVGLCRLPAPLGSMASVN